MTRFLSLLLCLILLVPVAGARELRIGLDSDPATLDPHRSAGITEGMVIAELFEGLLTRDAAGKPVPGVAERWVLAADRVTWRFHLRPDARWADGSAVTAGDFVAGWRRAVAPGSFAAETLSIVDGAAAVTAGEASAERLAAWAEGDRLFAVRLVRPVPDFPERLAHRATFPVQQAAALPDFARPGGFVGNGPYRLVERVPAGHLLLERNPHYHGAASVGIARVRLLIVPDDRTSYNLFRTGGLDISTPLSGTVAERVAAGPDAGQLHRTPRNATVFIGFHPDGMFAGSAPLRIALSRAIDRRVLVRDITRGGEMPAQTLVPPGLGLATRRPEAAVAIQGVALPGTLPLLHMTGENTRRQVVAIADFWKRALAVPVALEAAEPRVVIERYRAGAYEGMIYLSMQWDRAEAFLRQVSLPPAAGGLGYADPHYLSLLRGAEEAGDLETAKRLLAEAETRLLADAVLIPIYHPTAKRLVGRGLEGWRDNPGDDHPIRLLGFRAGSE